MGPTRSRARLVTVARHGPRTAFNWLRQFINSGDAEAMHKLGLLYFEGIGILLSFMLVHLWGDLSAVLGNDKAVQNREVIELSMSSPEIGEARAWADADRKTIVPVRTMRLGAEVLNKS